MFNNDIIKQLFDYLMEDDIKFSLMQKIIRKNDYYHKIIENLSIDFIIILLNVHKSEYKNDRIVVLKEITKLI